jgi:hypothetical protein
MKKFICVTTVGKAPPKWGPMGLKYSTFVLLDPERRSEI